MNILITGANRGIGLCLATLYTQAGHQVYAVCRSSSTGLDALESCTVLDNIEVTQAEALEQLSQQLGDVKLDVLINNAGIFLHEKLDNVDSHQLEQQLQINALAPLRLTQALLGKLQAGSKIAMITSRMGSIADNSSGEFYGYRMSKAALNAGSKSLALDLKSQGISVGIIHPGFVQTRMVNFAGDISPEQAAAQIADRIESLNLDNSGNFWHSNGELLPW